MSRLIFIVVSLALSVGIVFYAGGIVLNGSSDTLMQKIFLGNHPEGLKKLLTDKSKLNEALSNAEKLKTKISSLEEAQKNISAEDLAKLDKFIPNQIDNINLIIDINNIAARQNMTIKNVKVRNDLEGGAVGVPNEGVSTEVAGASRDSIADTYVSFSVSGSYNSLLSFLDDLANSLRVADVTSLAFSVDDKGVNQYNFEIKTHWVK
jgi:hypothetical protein